MVRSCVTISLVDEARGGPFVFWDDLEAGCRAASELGFDAVELFLPAPEAVDDDTLSALLEKYKLQVGAFGTGAGWVIHKKQICDPDPTAREAAKTFIKSIIDKGGKYNAPAIIGSMQGRSGGNVDHETAMSYLRTALNELGDYAAQYNVPLIYEPLNRYETNLVNTIADGVALLKTLETDNVVLLADLFHMNIEEFDVPQAIRDGKGTIGHIHFVDSTRQACTRGHFDFDAITAAIRDIDYDGYLSAEAFPVPDPRETARLTIETIRKYFPKN